MGNATESRDVKRKKAAPLLKKKHLLESKHAQRSVHLDNIRNVLDSVDSSITQQTVVKMLDSARTTLREINANKTTQPDAVDELFDELQDIMDDQKQIDAIIADRSSLMSGVEDESDLDKELDEIFANDQLEELKSGGEPAAAASAAAVPVTSRPVVAELSSEADDELLRELEALTVSDKPVPQMKLGQKPAAIASSAEKQLEPAK